MDEILQFLRDLQANNNREWFAANKNRYKKAQGIWNEFCLELIREVGTYDPDIAKLTLAQCTYRIYRDTRFSNDKSPYKTHFGVFLAPGGKKSMHAGYYFHVGTGETGDYPHAHMFAAGNYCYDPRTVKILREDISFGWEEFRDEVLGVADSRFEISEMDALKKCRKGSMPLHLMLIGCARKLSAWHSISTIISSFSQILQNVLPKSSALQSLLSTM